jgi:hypothetical protein
VSYGDEEVRVTCWQRPFTDAQVTPHPPIVRGLDLVVEKLRRAGHIVVEWKGPLRTTDILDVGWRVTESAARDDSESLGIGNG